MDEDVRNSLEKEQNENRSSTSRKAKIALAATVGGGLLAITGGLIAVPALAAALTSAAATGTVGAGFLTTAAAMASKFYTYMCTCERALGQTIIVDSRQKEASLWVQEKTERGIYFV